jgi:hypothetical protein
MRFVDGFHSVATLAFVLGSAVVSLRLLALAYRTREAPELLLGSALLCTAVLGYGILIAELVVRGGLEVAPQDVPPLAVVLAGVGRFLHNVGVSLFLLFVVQVFRRHTPWAWALAGALALLLWGGFAVGAAQGGLRVDRVGSAAWFCEYAVIWSYQLWSMMESYRYWGLLRRRAALGLADPLVMNRFLLWGTGSLFSTLAIWTASVPFAFMGDLQRIAEITPVVRIVTGALGLVCVSCLLFAFLPPAWYRRHVSAGASALEGVL